MADDLARLGVIVTPQGITITTEQLNKLAKQANDTQKRTENLTKSQRLAAAGMTVVSNRARTLTGSLTSLRGIIIGLGIAAAGRELVTLADTYTLINARVKLVTDSTRQATVVQSALFDIAQRSKSSFEALSTVYVRVARNADQLGASQGRVLKFTEALSQSITVSGASAGEATAGLRQLSQALASGEVRGDEFRSIMENLSFVAIQVSDSLGLTLGQLRKLSQEGGLTALKFFDALLDRTEEIQRQFDTLPNTVGRASNVFKNSFGLFVSQVNEATGATSDFADMIEGMADALSDPALVEQGAATIEGIKRAVEALVGFGPALKGLLDGILSFVGESLEFWDSMPTVIQQVGIIGGLIFGAKGWAALALFGSAVELQERFVVGLANMAAPGEDSQGLIADFLEGFGDPEQVRRALEAIGDPFALLQIQLDKTKESLDKNATSLAKAQIEFAKLILTMDTGSTVGDATVEWTTKEATAMGKLLKQLDPAAAIYNDLTEEVDLLNRAFETHQINEAEFSQLLDASHKRFVTRNEDLDKNKRKINDVVKELSNQIKLVKEEATLGERAATRLRMEIQLRQELGDEYGANADKIKELLDQLDLWNLKLERNEEATQRSKDAAQVWVEIWNNAARQIQGTFNDLFLSLFDGGLNLGNALANIFKQVFAQTATQAVLGGFIGGGGIGGGGGGGSLLSGALGGGAVAGSFGLASGAGIGGGGISGFVAANPFASIILGAGAGALGGGALSSALGLSKTGGRVGGAIGGAGAATAILAGVNPLIALAIPIFTSIIGGAFATIFSRPSNKTQGGHFDFATNTISSRGGLTGKRFSQENFNAVTSFFGNIEGIVAGLKATSPGADFSALGNLFFETGDRDGTRVAIGGQERQFKDIEDAWDFVIDQMREKVTGLKPIIETAFKTIDLSLDNSERALQLLDFAAGVQAILDDEAITGPQSRIQASLDAVEDQFVNIIPLLVEIGQEAELATELMAGLKQAIIDDFVGALDVTLNVLRGEGFLNSMQVLADQIEILRLDADAAGTGLEKVNEIFDLSIGNIIDGILGASASAEIATASLMRLKDAFPNIPELAGLIDEALGNIDSFFNADSSTSISTSVRLAERIQLSIIDKQLAVLRGQGTAGGRNVSNLSRITGGLDAALFDLGTGAGFGGTISERFEFAKSAFETTLATALGGDQEAQASLGQIGLAFLQISREFNATSTAFFEDRDAVQQGLMDVQGVAQNELDIAISQLEGINTQIGILTDIRDGTRTGGIPTTFTAADAEAISLAFSQAFQSSGMDLSSFVASPEFAIWEETRDTLIAGLTDVSKLLEAFSVASAQTSDPIFGPSGVGQRYLDAVIARMNELGIAVPGFAAGGSTGSGFKFHAGETVVMGNRAQVVSAETAKKAAAQADQNLAAIANTFNGGSSAIVQAIAGLQQTQDEMAAELKANQRAVNLALERMDN